MSPHSPARRRAATAAIATASLVGPLLTSVPAEAAPCSQVDSKHGNCNIIVHRPGGGGGGGSVGGGGSSGPVMPPPPEGLTANEAQGFVATPGGPAVPQAAPASTADLVAMARAATEFPVPVVHTAPKDKTYVGLRTSLWVEGFDDVQTKPISLGGQTVQLVAKPKSVTWDLGEREIVCDNAGSSDGRRCNYTYERSSAAQPGGSYKITATVTWDVAWTCEGGGCDAAGGDLGPNSVTSQPTALVVSEIQTNTRR